MINHKFNIILFNIIKLKLYFYVTAASGLGLTLMANYSLIKALKVRVGLRVYVYNAFNAPFDVSKQPTNELPLNV